MTNYNGVTKKRLADEQAFADGVRGKLAKAKGLHDEVCERFDMLCAQSELPDGVGVVVESERLAKAKKARDEAGDEVARLSAVLRESERRIAVAEQQHAAATVQDAWSESARLAAQLLELDEQFLAHCKRASETATKALALRKQLLDVSPGFKLRHPLTDAARAEMEGHDMRLAVLNEVGGRFHGASIARKPSDAHTADVAHIVGREKQFIRSLSEREERQGQATNGSRAAA